MSEEKSVPGLWTDSVCAYSDSSSRGPVLAAIANAKGSSRHGYLQYLSFKDNACVLQSGPVDDTSKLLFRDVPKEVAEAAIKAAIGVVLLWAGEQAAEKWGK